VHTQQPKRPEALGGLLGALTIGHSPEHFQRPTPSHVSSITSRAPRRGDDHVARGRRGRMKIRTPYSPLALFTRQRDDAAQDYQILLSAGVENISPAGAVPEPSTWALTLAGFAGLGWFAYLRRRKLTRA
jgi:hypothetical protein